VDATPVRAKSIERCLDVMISSIENNTIVLQILADKSLGETCSPPKILPVD
jgi:hypothetical protein